MSENTVLPRSPKDEVQGLPYFARMCHKIRLMRDGQLGEDYQPNLGKGFDLWTCEFLEINYTDLVKVVESEDCDEAALSWAIENGAKPEGPRLDWWLSYMRNRGVNDNLSDKLKQRKDEAGLGDRADVVSFFDFIDAEEGR